MMTDPIPQESPVFQRSRLSPGVTQPSSPWTVPLGLAGCTLLALIVFLSLAHARQAKANAAAPAPTAVALAPPPAAASEAAAPAPIQSYTPPPAATPADDPSRRWRSPTLVVDLTEAGPAAPATASPAATATARTEDKSELSAQERFAAQVSSSGVETARATRLRDLARVAPQGTVIPAVLETAINSDLPGSVRAVVSQDVRGFDGSMVLIPRGSRLIGQYRSGVAQGQSRAFVIWSRILTLDGVSIDVGSPATDPLGRGGLAGETDTHFFARYGGAILMSVLNVGLEAAFRQGGTNTSIIIGAQDLSSRVTGAVPQAADIPVTVKVAQGSPLQVFVTRDLDFTGLAPTR